MGTRTSDISSAVGNLLLGKLELAGSEVPPLASVTGDHARRFWQALGLPSVPPSEKVYTRRDVDALRFTASLINGEPFGHREPVDDGGPSGHAPGGVGPDREMLLQMTRATGQALSRVAHMHVLSIADEITAITRNPALSNNEAADRIAALAEALVRGYEPFLGYIWRRHLFASISQIVAGASGQMGRSETTTVGFADLVGYTAITLKLADHEIVDIVDRFEKIAYQEIPERGGRVIKTLGDEVMFSNADPHAAGQTALALAAACNADPVLPDVRVGLAAGPMLAWEGDFYGPTVNLASRLGGIATPGTVIISDDLADKLADDDAFTLIEIRGVKLKGIGKTKPWVLRPRTPAKPGRAAR